MNLAPADFLGLLWGSVVAMALFLCVAWTGWCLAVAATGRRVRPSARWAAAAVSVYWLLGAVFSVTLTLSLFKIDVVAGAMAVLAAIVSARRARRRLALVLLRRDLSLLMILEKRLRALPLLMIASIVASGEAFRRMLMAVVEPPLSWDALTYHLLKAGRWVQSGGLAAERAPDAWTYYEYFPPIGDSFWAWAMLPVRGEGLLAYANLLVWASLIGMTYAAARQFGAARRSSFAAGLACGFIPAVYNVLFGSYVDNLSAVFFLGAALFADRAWRSGRAADLALTCAALALGAGTKLNFVPAAAAAMVVLFVRCAVSAPPHIGRGLAAALAACLLPMAINVPHMFRAWAEQGSPLYPLRLQFGPLMLHPGNEQLAWLLAGGKAAEAGTAVPGLAEVLVRICIVSTGNPPYALGYGAPLVVMGALFWILRGAARGASRFARAAVPLAALILVGPLFLESSRMMRLDWLPALGRFVVPAYALILAAAAAAWPARAATGLMLLVWALSFFHLTWESSLPAHGETRLAVLAVGAGGALFIWLTVRRTQSNAATKKARYFSGAMAFAGVIVFLTVTQVFQRTLRYQFYAQMGQKSPLLGGSAQVWRSVDQERPLKIATSAGWNGYGFNITRYPLLGTRLQNEAFYVPPTTDGTLPSFGSTEKLDVQAWGNRLVQREVDVVVLFGPLSHEGHWVMQQPELFEPLAVASNAPSASYRFRRDRWKAIGHGRP